MFGFDIQPVRSRNWEIEEEEDQNLEPVEIPKPSILFNESFPKNDLSNITDLIISTKNSPSIFIRSNFDALFDEIAEIVYDDIKPIKTTSNILNNKCNVYRHKEEKSIAFIVLGYDLPSERCFSFSESVLNAFNQVKKVVILDKLLNSHYLSQDHTHPIPPFVRAVYTSNFENNCSLIPLESPNIIENLSASFLTLCQVNNIQACSILNLYELNLNIDSVQSFAPILKSLYPKLFSTNDNDIKVQYKNMIALVNKRNDRGMYM
ncbi:hypothetical protein DICPUDRAFT_31172 [Dictyostelium purpureum]|uniref:Proteasome assembly chaperone 1 n=1 Tax=Dictyostelium purpureum TaxID=5786 RepID=F0ZGP3_DICPU|nr:uncharacterized protein DICPUDRAFT_31172 [Dictyostelium purpureum]EGC36860.1 hypothetical protein DICPUDRAFT_31172 [Dictyostelium purpureum]|eukprot:XP_003286582.1 hypothetical protein DICPUDRAFT_31172 [Dictyostelium purpureum]